jgi:hypothetical protein
MIKYDSSIIDFASQRPGWPTLAGSAPDLEDCGGRNG